MFAKGTWHRRINPTGVRVRRLHSARFEQQKLTIEAKQALRERPIAATRTAAERAADEARVSAIHWRQEQAELRLQRKIEQRRKARHMTR